jgi:hypothetical protein
MSFFRWRKPEQSEELDPLITTNNIAGLDIPIDEGGVRASTPSNPQKRPQSTSTDAM